MRTVNKTTTIAIRYSLEVCLTYILGAIRTVQRAGQHKLATNQMGASYKQLTTGTLNRVINVVHDEKASMKSEGLDGVLGIKENHYVYQTVYCTHEPSIFKIYAENSEIS